MALIRIQGLRKRYRGSQVPALRGLDLQVDRGEFLGLLGPNGAGKTTALSILCGLLRASGGQVQADGVDVLRHPAAIKRQLGLVPQEIGLYPTLTARENLCYFARMHGLGGARLRERVQRCLELVGLQESADRRVATYSGGMKRRANLVAGLIHEPSILVLDEPTVGIDAQSRGAIAQLLQQVNAAGATLIYATHYMEEAQQLCSRVAIIDRGRILRQGAPADLIRETGCQNLEQVFLELTGRSLRD